MAVYKIKIDERTKEGKQLLEYLKSLDVIIKTKIEEELEQAIDDIKNGRVYELKNNDLKELLK